MSSLFVNHPQSGCFEREYEVISISRWPDDTNNKHTFELYNTFLTEKNGCKESELKAQG